MLNLMEANGESFGDHVRVHRCAVCDKPDRLLCGELLDCVETAFYFPG